MLRVAVLLLLFVFGPPSAAGPGLDDPFARIDDDTPGSLGVYVKALDSGDTWTHQIDRDWYLASTIKIPLAVVVLQKVEEGELSLTDEIELQEGDFVDGSGDLQYADPGRTYTIKTLIEEMLKNSDSIATDMLMRTIGAEAFNEHLREHVAPEGFNEITSILQVRYDAYSHLHERADELSNRDIMDLRSYSLNGDRRAAFAEKLSLSSSDLKASSVADAFERYYDTGLNSGRLDAMGDLLERLVRGDLLSDEHTDFLLDVMEGVTTGDDRIKAGLPDDTRFAHKTGTQIGRACNVGVVFPEENSRDDGVVVAACTEKFGALSEAEATLARVGSAVAKTVWHADAETP